MSKNTVPTTETRVTTSIAFVTEIENYLKNRGYHPKSINSIDSEMPNELQKMIWLTQHTIVVGVKHRVEDFKLQLPTKGIFLLKSKGRVYKKNGFYKECKIKQLFLLCTKQKEVIQVLVCKHHETTFFLDNIKEFKYLNDKEEHSKGFEVESAC